MPADLPGYNNSQCIILGATEGIIDNIRIEDNWINGGGWSVQSRDKADGFGVPSNVVLINNRFGRDFRFGPWIIEGDSATIEGNLWDDTGNFMPGQSDEQPSPPTNISVRVL